MAVEMSDELLAQVDLHPMVVVDADAGDGARFRSELPARGVLPI